MLDRYWYGDASRISPEAPVPVVLFREETTRPGGAANVAANVVLISLFSLNGAAAAASLTQLLLAVGLLTAARGLARDVSWTRVLAGPLLAGALAALAMAAFRDDLGAALAVGAAVYVPVLVVFERLAYPADARALRDFVLRRAE